MRMGVRRSGTDPNAVLNDRVLTANDARPADTVSRSDDRPHSQDRPSTRRTWEVMAVHTTVPVRTSLGP